MTTTDVAPQASEVWSGFAARADRDARAPALVWRDDEVSYGELLSSTAAARGRLDALDLAPAEPVVLLADKSPRAVALVLACLQDRRPFLLPPPSLPRRQVEAAMDQAGARYVVREDGDRMSIERRAPDESTPTPPRAGLGGVSFVFTTSGSTGAPKVVPLSTRGVNRFVDWVATAFGYHTDTTTLSYGPLNFVVCLLDLWATLARGGRVVLVDGARSTSPGYLVDLLARHEIHLVQAVPMFYRLLLDGTEGGALRFPTVEHMISTGDGISPGRLAQAGQLFPSARLHNGYGCTETLTSFFNEVTTELSGTTVPLGQPLPGVHVLVVDDGGDVVEGPGSGELYVATPFQTAGYLDETLNAARFVPHPRGEDGVRYFRTGDVVRRDADGTLTLVGRNDFETKVRGVRINAQEVERALVEHDEVVEAAVVALPDPIAGHLLHAVVRRASADGANSLVLRRHCAERLPRAAIPSTIRFVDDALPRTASGKLDRRAVERSL